MAALAAAAGGAAEHERRGADARAGGGGARARRHDARATSIAGQVVLAAGAWTAGARARPRACGCPSSRPRATASTWSAPPTSPSCRFYLGEAHVVLTPLGARLRLGSTLELAGWDMRVRPRRVARLRAGAARVLGLDERGPCSQIWRGPRPVTPDGLPVIGRVPRRRAGHRGHGPLHARPLARARHGAAGRRPRRRTGGRRSTSAPLSPRRFA